MTALLKKLISHIDICPLSWHDDKVIVHKATKQSDVLDWIKKLNELNKNVKEQELSLLDVRNHTNKQHIKRTM
jgi:hypothetical protein